MDRRSKNSLWRTLIACLLCLAAAMPVMAQRRVTPVEPVDPLAKPVVDESRRKPKSERPASVVTQIDDSGKEILVDTISGSEYVDSAALAQPKVIGNIYPLLHSLTVGVDLWDPLMRAFNQKYGIAGVWAELSLHNRYNPIVEFGLGSASSTPEDMNFTYRSSVAPYFKIGCNYNFLYNSNPDYQLYAGVRYGITGFNYRVTDVTVSNGYWDEVSVFDIPRQHSTTGYAEVLAGLKVKIAGRWSIGWCIKYHALLHSSRAPYGKAWYIPGYGTRSSVLGVSLSVMYTLPLNSKSATPFEELMNQEADPPVELEPIVDSEQETPPTSEEITKSNNEEDKTEQD